MCLGVLLVNEVFPYITPFLLPEAHEKEGPVTWGIGVGVDLQFDFMSEIQTVGATVDFTGTR